MMEALLVLYGLLTFFNVLVVGIMRHNFRSLFCKHKYEERKKKVCACTEDIYFFCTECGHTKDLNV